MQDQDGPQWDLKDGAKSRSFSLTRCGRWWSVACRLGSAEGIKYSRAEFAIVRPMPRQIELLLLSAVHSNQHLAGL